ncbi:MAG: hypothetical protein QM296_10490 [Bacillota bacterium]|nr:hypothetical protein [Bacillota bacterium]
MKRRGTFLIAVLSASLLLSACSGAARSRKTDANSSATRNAHKTTTAATTVTSTTAATTAAAAETTTIATSQAPTTSSAVTTVGSTTAAKITTTATTTTEDALTLTATTQETDATSTATLGVPRSRTRATSTTATTTTAETPASDSTPTSTRDLTVNQKIRFSDIEPVIAGQHLKANEPFFGEDDITLAPADVSFADLKPAITAARDYRSCRIFSRFALGICNPGQPDAVQMLDLLLYSDHEGRRLLNDQVDSLNEGAEHLILYLSEDGIWHRQPNGSYRDVSQEEASITPLGLWQLYEIIFAEEDWTIYLGRDESDDENDDDYDTVILHLDEIGDKAFDLLLTAYTLTIADLDHYERELTIAFRLEEDDDHLALTAFDATLLLTHRDIPAQQVAFSIYTLVDKYDDIDLPSDPVNLDDDIKYLEDFYKDELFGD